MIGSCSEVRRHSATWLLTLSFVRESHTTRLAYAGFSRECLLHRSAQNCDDVREGISTSQIVLRTAGLYETERVQQYCNHSGHRPNVVPHRPLLQVVRPQIHGVGVSG